MQRSGATAIPRASSATVVGVTSPVVTHSEPRDGIGTVSETNKPEYSDGDVENDLLSYFDGSKPFPKAETWDWAHTYHLSPLRSNLVSWIDFEQGAKVLEVGAGCGAITSALAEKDIEVTALELSRRRLAVNRARNSHRNNVTYVNSNISALGGSRKFDACVCVGVLEYSGTFIEGQDPYKEFLRIISSELTASGSLFIAIENRLGLKYWSGAKEDHTASLFEGLEGYPGPRKVQTFSRKQLSELLSSVGLTHQEFYYPFPDYKLPQVVYGDAVLSRPEYANLIGHKFLAAPAHDQVRHQLFSERLAAQQLIEAGIFEHFGNSFLVKASAEPTTDGGHMLVAIPQPTRDPKYRLTTKIVEEGGTVTVLKRATTESVPHLEQIVQNHAAAGDAARSLPGLDVAQVSNRTTDAIRFEVVPGPTLEARLNACFSQKDTEGAVGLIQRHIDYSGSLRPEHGGLYLDFIYDNIVVDDDDHWTFVDNEWVGAASYQGLLVPSRALFTHLKRFEHSFKRLSESVASVLVGDLVIPEVVYATFSNLVDLFPKVQEAESILFAKVGQAAAPPSLQISYSDPKPFVLKRKLNSVPSEIEHHLEEQEATITSLLDTQHGHVRRIDGLVADLLGVGDERADLLHEVALRDRLLEEAIEREATTMSDLERTMSDLERATSDLNQVRASRTFGYAQRLSATASAVRRLAGKVKGLR